MSEVLKEFLPPGSDEAIKAGCRCPVLDNHHGAGLYTDENGERQYVYNVECPVHRDMLSQKRPTTLEAE